MNRQLVIASVLLILTAIILGAFGAHALEKLVSPEKLSSYETGVRYQVYTGIALLAIGLQADRFAFSLKGFMLLQLIGVLFFSGSIYLLSLQEPLGMSLKFLGPVTPLGGSLMIAGWVVILVQLLRKK